MLYPIGATRVVANNGYRRRWVKINHPDKWKLNAIHIYEDAMGKLGKGMVVHHRDKNTLNDALSNLVALTRKEHSGLHRQMAMSCHQEALNFGRQNLKASK
jgi:hypothetical protein